MIAEIVLTAFTKKMARDEVLAAFERTVDNWTSTPDLAWKVYLFDEESRVVGGIYLWKERSAPSLLHGKEFMDRAQSVFGATPIVRTFDAPIVIDNLSGVILRENEKKILAQR